jgi:LPXTG-motif cell wall-anchored protein
VPAFVAAGEAGDDGMSSSELGGLLGAGGFLAAAGAFIASRRRKGARA